MSKERAPSPTLEEPIDGTDISSGAIVSSYHIDGAAVEIGIDPEGPIGSRNFLTVTGDEYHLKRYFFFEDSDQAAIDEFARRVVHEPGFRERSLSGRATWSRVSEIYIEASRRIETVFRERGLLTFRVGDATAKRRHDEARDHLRSICETVFQEIDTEVRSDRLISGLDSFVDEQIDRASEIADDLSGRDC